MATNPLLKPTSEDILGQSMMPSGASSGATTSTTLTRPIPPVSGGGGAGGSWTSPQIAQASPAPVRVAPTISQAYQAPRTTQPTPIATTTPTQTAPQQTYDFSQDAFTPQANVGGSVDAMLRQVQPSTIVSTTTQPAFKNTYWDPGIGKYVEGNMETDRPWEKYGLGSANALYNTDERTLRALLNRKNGTIGEQYGTQTINEDEIRQRTMDRFQAEIDAMNRYYAEKTQQELGVAQEAGRGRVGTRTAISARRGMLGGDFGDTAREEVVRYNQQIENNIYNLNQKERLFQELQMRGAATKAAEEAIDKARARLDESIAKAEELRQKALKEVEQRVTNRLAAFFADGREMTEEDYANIAAEMGVDIDQVKAMSLQFRPETPKQTGDAAEFAYYSSLTPEQQEAYLDFKKQTAAPTSLGATVNEYEYYKRQEEAAGRTPVSFNEYQTLDANRKARAAAITAGGLNSAQQSAAFKLADDYEKASGVLPKVISNYNSMSAAAQDPTPAGDISLIFAYMKMLDPTSVVRENEFATAQNAGSIPTSIQNIWNKAVQGTRLTPEQRTDFVNQANKLYQSALSQQRQVDQTFEERSRQFGVPSSLVVRGQSSYLDTPSPTSSALSPASGSPVSISQIENIAGMTLSPTLRAEVQSAIQEFPNLTADQIAQAFGFNSVGGDTNQATKTSVGSLSQRFESSGDPGAIGRDSTGGWSYGAYQLAHSNAKRFVDASPYARDFQGIAFNSPQFRQKWKEVARRDPQGFKQAQQSFIEQTHIAPQMQKLASAGINPARYSPVFQEVLFSTAVQHGPNNDVIEKAIKRVGANASEDALIKAIYEERWAGGKRFASSTPQVRKAVYNRFFGKDGELNSALKQLA
jgi:hypothetical protein